jgi:hypothetical protein
VRGCRRSGRWRWRWLLRAGAAREQQGKRDQESGKNRDRTLHMASGCFWQRERGNGRAGDAAAVCLLHFSIQETREKTKLGGCVLRMHNRLSYITAVDLLHFLSAMKQYRLCFAGKYAISSNL